MLTLVPVRAVADDGGNNNRNKGRRRVRARHLLIASLLFAGIAPASAQHYPQRPVRIVVGFPAGGPTDGIARLVAQVLGDSLGQQFYVENVGGAGGNTAAGQVARATPDGYTIMGIST